MTRLEDILYELIVEVIDKVENEELSRNDETDIVDMRDEYIRIITDTLIGK